MPNVPAVSRRNCCVPFCRNNTEKLFMFPKEQNLGALWLENINNPRFRYENYHIIRRNFRVCGKHFLPSNFSTEAKTRLVRGVVPTQFSDDDSQTLLQEIESGAPETASSSTTYHLPSTVEEEEVPPLPQPFNEERYRRSRRRRRRIDILRKAKSNLASSKVTFGVVKRTLLALAGNKSSFQHSLKKFLLNLSAPAVTFIVSQLKKGNKFNKSRKWTDAEKAVFLSIYKVSPKCYRFLKRFFCLPSPRTLQRSLQSVNLRAAINDNIFQHLSILSDEMKPLNRYCVLMFDEVYLQPNISTSRQYKSVFGLEDFGSGSTKHIADHALVFMLRGINQKWKQPISYYFVKSGTKTSMLKNLIRDVIKSIHSRTNFRILATISDQGTANQSAVTQLSRESGHFDHFIFKISDFVGNQRVEYTIFHIFYPPHLLKCMRNHFLQKDIYFDDKVAKWSDLEQLYRFDGDNPDSKMCLKLTEKHIRPEGRLKMRVSLASQVFSRSVYAALQFSKNVGGWQCSPGTAEFVLFIDKLFDSMNGVRNSTKPLRRPLTDGSAHNDFWGQAKPFLAKLVFKKRNVIVNAPPSVKNYIASIRNIQALWNCMKGLGFKYLLTRCLNQDPLENFFGIIRGLCGQNHRPTCSQFVAAFKTSLINNLQSLSSLTNCEDDGTDFLVSLLKPVPNPVSVFIPSVPSTSFSSRHFTLPLPNTEISNISKEVLTMRSNTSSYIAGFIYKKFMKHDCSTCNEYFITTSPNADSHAFIISREYGTLIYPSNSFIKIVNRYKFVIYREFILNINSSDLQEAIGLKLPKSLFSVCLSHDNYHSDIVKTSLTIIIIKYCCTIINRKLTNKDMRVNKLIDDYLNVYGTTLKQF